MTPAEKPDIITLLNDNAAPVNVQYYILDTDIATRENQNNFAGFIGTRSYPISTQIAQTPPVIEEIGGSMIMAG
ncbi:MAG: hypothetical protein EZS28_023183 [Streblomastix strix]|uniref:Uncharacterized protein n=1 Tax=Streblomastix strix TaxID=222440 RepID=A0A5J4VFC7_9EUKA|nr:MAG: hypothetical protein EZS28_023183 [Streblomastix strix]